MEKIIFFDLDGTLLDTLQDLTDSVNYAMDKLGLARYTAEQVREMVGNGVVVLMRRAVTSEHSNLAEQALVYQREYYNKHTNDYTKPYDGIESMLYYLKDKGFTIAVHTNKDANCAWNLCREYFGTELIEYVCGTCDSITKPNPARVLDLMKSRSVSKSNAVYCGDSDVDLQTAANAGINCISVTWGFRSKDFLLARGAKYLADSPLDVISHAMHLTGQK